MIVILQIHAMEAALRAEISNGTSSGSGSSGSDGSGSDSDGSSRVGRRQGGANGSNSGQANGSSASGSDAKGGGEKKHSGGSSQAGHRSLDRRGGSSSASSRVGVGGAGGGGAASDSAGSQQRPSNALQGAVKGAAWLLDAQRSCSDFLHCAAPPGGHVVPYKSPQPRRSCVPFPISFRFHSLWTTSVLFGSAATVHDCSVKCGAAEGAGEHPGAERQLLAGLNPEAKAGQEQVAGSSGQLGGEARHRQTGAVAQSKAPAAQQNPQVHCDCM